MYIFHSNHQIATDTLVDCLLGAAFSKQGSQTNNPRRRRRGRGNRTENVVPTQTTVDVPLTLDPQSVQQ